MSENSADERSRRCRLVLIIPPAIDDGDQLEAALGGGDVASVIVASGDLDPASYQDHCEKLVPVAQRHDVAALVCDDTQIMGRSGADGVFLTRPGDKLKELVARFSPHKIVGCGGVRDRHRAMEFGVANPDFVFFGKPDGDIRPEPHPKNLALAAWWSEMIEIPCIVMGGSGVESVVDCAATGAEFVALGVAVFSHGEGPQAAVRLANRLLDEHAPVFEEA